MSGFSPLSPVRGPPDEKLAKPVKFGFAIDVGVTVAVRPFGGAELAAVGRRRRRLATDAEERDRDVERLARVRVAT